LEITLSDNERPKLNHFVITRKPRDYLSQGHHTVFTELALRMTDDHVGVHD
jgi:hypothetical protein